MSNRRVQGRGLSAGKEWTKLFSSRAVVESRTEETEGEKGSGKTENKVLVIQRQPALLATHI
jgi:hypothetical protein